MERSVASPSEDGLGIASRKPHPTDQTDASLTPERSVRGWLPLSSFSLGGPGSKKKTADESDRLGVSDF